VLTGFAALAWLDGGTDRWFLEASDEDLAYRPGGAT
jgi:hypothetical protein